MFNVIDKISSSIKEIPRERLVTAAVIGCALAAIVAGSVFLGIGTNGLLPVKFFDYGGWMSYLLKGTLTTHMLYATAIAAGGALMTVGLYILIRKGVQKLKMKFDCIRHLDEKMDKSVDWRIIKIIFLSSVALAALTILVSSIYYLHSMSSHYCFFHESWIYGHEVSLTGCKLVIAGMAVGSASLAFAAAYTAFSIYDYVKKKKEQKEAAKLMVSGPLNNNTPNYRVSTS